MMTPTSPVLAMGAAREIQLLLGRPGVS
jgi:hypothetical protein